MSDEEMVKRLTEIYRKVFAGPATDINIVRSGLLQLISAIMQENYGRDPWSRLRQDSESE